MCKTDLCGARSLQILPSKAISPALQLGTYLLALYSRARIQYNKIYWEGTAKVLHGVVLIYKEQ